MKTLHPVTQIALCLLCPAFGSAGTIPALAGMISPDLARAAYAGFYLAKVTSQTGRSKRKRRDSGRR